MHIHSNLKLLVYDYPVTKHIDMPQQTEVESSNIGIGT